MSIFDRPVGTLDGPDKAMSVKEQNERARTAWASVGIAQKGTMAPLIHAKYIQGLCAVLTGKHLLEQIDNADPDTIATFADRRPPAGRALERVLEIQHNVESNAMLEKQHEADIVRVLALCEEKHQAQVNGMQAVKAGDAGHAAYHFAREYALGYQINGEVTILQYRLDGGAL